MLRRKRRWYTAAEKSEMWDRWQRGESFNAIARTFETSHSAISKSFVRFGGIRPPGQERSRLALTLSEREEISRGVVIGLSLRMIARQLDRAPSTISREIGRNGGQKRYRANQANKAAWDRAHRPKPCKLAGNLQLSRIIAGKLQCYWSPEQIAGWRIKYPGRRCRQSPRFPDQHFPAQYPVFLSPDSESLLDFATLDSSR
jgi:IS30 family transposase